MAEIYNEVGNTKGRVGNVDKTRDIRNGEEPERPKALYTALV